MQLLLLGSNIVPVIYAITLLSSYTCPIISAIILLSSYTVPVISVNTLLSSYTDPVISAITLLGSYTVLVISVNTLLSSYTDPVISAITFFEFLHGLNFAIFIVIPFWICFKFNIEYSIETVISFFSAFCVYNGVAYQQGKSWNVGCDKQCRCDDASKNIYNCADRLVLWHTDVGP